MHFYAGPVHTNPNGFETINNVTASLKWRLGAWSIQGLPLLAASPYIEIMPPWMAQQRNPAMSPHPKGKEQTPVTLKNISGEKPTMPRGRTEGEENGWQNLGSM